MNRPLQSQNQARAKNSAETLRLVTSFLVGVLFAFGLGIAGMTQPAKVIGFLDVFGHWDFSLVFVMGGAVGVHLITYPLIRRRARPLADEAWHVPTKTQITPQLILGALIFGAGWGLGGFCPGPALISLATGEMKPLIFVAAMALGMMLYRAIEPKVPWSK